MDEEPFHPAAVQPPATTQRPLQLGYVGRLVVDKGLDDALNAMARTSARVRLAIMGEGPHEAALRARARELGLEEQVSFQGWAEPTEVARFIQNLDALILLTRATPTTLEQFGRAIVEAQSCGVPVIGAATGAIPSVIGDGGWVVPERNPQVLAALIDVIAASAQERHQRALAGRKNVATRFTYDAIAQDLAEAWIAAAGKAARERGAGYRPTVPAPSQRR